MSNIIKNTWWNIWHLYSPRIIHCTECGWCNKNHWGITIYRRKISERAMKCCNTGGWIADGK